MISGKINLVDGFGVICNTRKYDCKSKRNEIIKLWEETYHLKNKHYYIHIIPDTNQEVLTNGYLSIFSEKTGYFKNFYNRFFKNPEHRDKIIADFILQEKQEKYCLEIKLN
jgi:hypothetical protein